MITHELILFLNYVYVVRGKGINDLWFRGLILEFEKNIG